MTSASPHTAVANKREAQKEARCNAIIDAAVEEFATHGFTATKLDDVAVRAGIGKGTIYLYFESKERLFEAVIRRTLFPGRDQAISFVDGFAGSAAELLSIHFSQMHAFMHSAMLPATLLMVVGEALRFPQLSQFFYDEIIQPSQNLVLSIIRKGIASGEFRADAEDIYTQFLVAPVMHGAMWNLQFRDVAPIDPERYARNHVAFILRALRST
ncbi:MAG: TetR/AcrR family transcriptional regulator [Pseudomonadales bacterium]|jgi:AcrR family transcriptional regulator|nr:TetR/AcrR family transcriptional regulator [Pseudomonadales bacterium]